MTGGKREQGECRAKLPVLRPVFLPFVSQKPVRHDRWSAVTLLLFYAGLREPG